MRAKLADWVKRGGLRTLLLVGLGLAIAFASSQTVVPVADGELAPPPPIWQATGWDVACGIGVGVLLALIGAGAGVVAAYHTWRLPPSSG